MLMKNWLPFTAGFLTFVVAHAILRAHWHDWFQGTYDPWFLNSGRAILFTVGAVSATSAVVAAAISSARLVTGITFAAGGFVAMTAILFLRQGGPGTIFPIVMVFGGVFLLVSSVAGAWAGTTLGRNLRARR
jgi:hypothetical protein